MYSSNSCKEARLEQGDKELVVDPRAALVVNIMEHASVFFDISSTSSGKAILEIIFAILSPPAYRS